MLAPKLSLPDQSSERKTYCLLPSALQHGDGTGPVVDLGAARPNLLVVTLGINHVVENARLVVSIWGSAYDGNWGERPLLSFSPKSYCGVYAIFLDLQQCSGIRYLQASWNMVRSVQASQEPFFGFYLAATESNPDQLSNR